jgi:hypothetical protein
MGCSEQLRHCLLSYLASGRFASPAELDGTLLDRLLEAADP